MIFPGSPVAWRTWPAAAALVFLACLTIAAAWSVTEATRAAGQVRRSSVTLVQLAQLRAAIAEARLTPPSDRNKAPDSPRQRARRAARGLIKLHRDRPPERERFEHLDALVRERMTPSAGAMPDRAAFLDREIDRLALDHETRHAARLEESSRRLELRGRQTLFLVATLGILAAGATARAFGSPLR